MFYQNDTIQQTKTCDSVTFCENGGKLTCACYADSLYSVFKNIVAQGKEASDLDTASRILISIVLVMSVMALYSLLYHADLDFLGGKEQCRNQGTRELKDSEKRKIKIQETNMRTYFSFFSAMLSVMYLGCLWVNRLLIYTSPVANGVFFFLNYTGHILLIYVAFRLFSYKKKVVEATSTTRKSGKSTRTTRQKFDSTIVLAVVINTVNAFITFYMIINSVYHIHPQTFEVFLAYFCYNILLYVGLLVVIKTTVKKIENTINTELDPIINNVPIQEVNRNSRVIKKCKNFKFVDEEYFIYLKDIPDDNDIYGRSLTILDILRINAQTKSPETDENSFLV